jgi:hypothetical protein
MAETSTSMLCIWQRPATATRWHGGTMRYALDHSISTDLARTGLDLYLRAETMHANTEMPRKSIFSWRIGKGATLRQHIRSHWRLDVHAPCIQIRSTKFNTISDS